MRRVHTFPFSKEDGDAGYTFLIMLNRKFSPPNFFL